MTAGIAAGYDDGATTAQVHMGADGQRDPFGTTLRRFRREAGLSQEMLAARSGLSVDTIAALERGRRRAPRAATVGLLAKALDTDARTLAAAAESGEREDHVPAPRRPVVPPIAANIPSAPNELVGRGPACADVLAEFDRPGTRLVTLTGPGGVGKTRLATAVAHTLIDQRHEQVCWLSLAPLPGAPALAKTLLRQLDIRETSDRTPFDAIIDRLRTARLVLVLDNCEHVLSAAAEMCDGLIMSCPQVRILATTRELLKVDGEQVYAVPPLELPAPDWPATELQRSPAVRLFLGRARALQTPLQPTLADLPAVAAICTRLTGIPLAIELAAARLNVLSAAQIADALRRSTSVLGTGSRTALRHHSMDTAIGWSFELLTDRERAVCTQLSVFAGGWTLAAAEQVCRPHSAGTDWVELMGRLVDKSLVVVRRDGGETRYEMLTVIREYAEDRLRESGRLTGARRAHVDYYLSVAEQANPHLSRSSQGAWLDMLDAELDNIRAAMVGALALPESEPALRLAAAIWQFCYLRGHYSLGRRYLQSVLARPDLSSRLPDLPQASVLLGAGTLAFLVCDYKSAQTQVGQALQTFKRLHDRAGWATSLQRMGAIARERGQYAEADRLHRRSRHLWEELGDAGGQAWACNHLAFVSGFAGISPPRRRRANAPGSGSTRSPTPRA